MPSSLDYGFLIISHEGSLQIVLPKLSLTAYILLEAVTLELQLTSPGLIQKYCFYLTSTKSASSGGYIKNSMLRISLSDLLTNPYFFPESYTLHSRL